MTISIYIYVLTVCAANQRRHRFEQANRFRQIAALLLAVGVGTSSALAAEFRTFDGSGNNFGNPSQGAANTRVIRFGYDADYPDGIGNAITQSDKPNPRDVSNAINAQSTSILNDRGLSDWVVHWGQFLTHDMTLIKTGAQYNTLSTGEIGDFRIPINGPNDPLGPNPISFDRSAFDPTSGNGEIVETPRGTIPIPRWQINSNTSYIDASQVYGSDQATADSLRTFADGKLATSGNGLLPMLGGDNRFVAGDTRANENVGLTAIHSLFVREHNRLAERIKTHDATLSDEAIYQWARKIVGAEIQAITYREFLPAVMGEGTPSADDYYYDVIDASITTAFSTAAFRFGHSMQSPRILLVDNKNAEVGAVGLAAATENPAYLVSDPAKVELILKGLASQTAQENDAYIINGLRNIRFGPPGTGGTDLAALDIQRGRDHGLIDNYYSLRSSYGRIPLSDFDQLTSDRLLQVALEEVYGEINNLDAWIGMIAEDHLPGSSLGDLTQIITLNQFQRLRDGDRFFYTGDPDLQDELVTAVIDLNTITLGQIIQRNTGIARLQYNVFFVAPEPATWCTTLFGVCVLIPKTRFRRRAACQAINQAAHKSWKESLLFSMPTRIRSVRLTIRWAVRVGRSLQRGGNEGWHLARVVLLAVVVSITALAEFPAAAQHHEHNPPGNPANPLGCDPSAGEACFYARADGALVNPSTTSSVAEIYLALSSDRSELRYKIFLDDLVGFKPNLEDRIEPDDILGIHLHIHDPGGIGPHVLNVFGWSTPTFWGQEDADLVIDYENRTLTGIYDVNDATIDPLTGEPYLPFFFATTKVIDDYLIYLERGELVMAVHTVESGFAKWALHGPIHSVVPEPTSGLLFALAISLAWAASGRGTRFALRRCRCFPIDS